MIISNLSDVATLLGIASLNLLRGLFEVGKGEDFSCLNRT